MPITFAPEAPSHGAAIQRLLQSAFDADWPNRPAARLRASVAPLAELALVALDGASVVGSIRYYPVSFGHARLPGLMLGPLAVRTALRGQGVAQVLMHISLAHARNQAWERVVLVGDPDYYGRLGFVPAWPYGLTLDGETDRLQVLGLEPGALDGIAGPVATGEWVRRVA